MQTFLRWLVYLLVVLGGLIPSGLALSGSAGLPPLQDETPTLMPAAPAPADIINAVNDLRLAHGLIPLAVHPVLMQVAAEQANALAASEGAIGHERPCGMTLGQDLLSRGYPLLGDLSLDGYRSENWAPAATAQDAVSMWLGDDEHANTMLSPNRSDIGAAVAVGDQIYVVIETAWSTRSGQMQYDARAILTSIPVTRTACAGYTDSSDVSRYSIPVAISTARPDGDVVHEVKYGQTLWSLADRYHVSVDQIKRLNGLTDDTIVPGWKLLIQKAATQPALATPSAPAIDATVTRYPTAVPFYTPTLTVTATTPPMPVGQFVRQNSMVVAALLISFSVLVAGLVRFGRKKDRDG